MKKNSIVIDREYGSGGREVARILSEKLGMAFYDGDLLVMAGREYGIDLGTLRDYDEKGVGGALPNLSLGKSPAFGVMNDAPYQVFSAQSRLVQQLVAKKVSAATEGIVYEAADVNGDGEVTAQDASLIQQHVAKKIDLSTINK